jgi:hypothetical protein
VFDDAETPLPAGRAGGEVVRLGNLNAHGACVRLALAVSKA